MPARCNGRTNRSNRSGASTQIKPGQFPAQAIFRPVGMLRPQSILFPPTHLPSKLQGELRSPGGTQPLPGSDLQRVDCRLRIARAGYRRRWLGNRHTPNLAVRLERASMGFPTRTAAVAPKLVPQPEGMGRKGVTDRGGEGGRRRTRYAHHNSKSEKRESGRPVNREIGNPIGSPQRHKGTESR
jgi:hypothetical protein